MGGLVGGAGTPPHCTLQADAQHKGPVSPELLLQTVGPRLFQRPVFTAVGFMATVSVANTPLCLQSLKATHTWAGLGPRASADQSPVYRTNSVSADSLGVRLCGI